MPANANIASAITAPSREQCNKAQEMPDPSASAQIV
jgi:hypothetical protein